MHGTLYDDRQFRLLSVIDDENWERDRVECGSPFPPTHLLRVLDKLVDFFGSPRVIRMDNGLEMTSAMFAGRSVHLCRAFSALVIFNPLA